MKTGILRVNNKPLFVVVIGAILAIFLFAGVFEGEAQAAAYEAVVTCDDVGYSVTLSPDWGQTWTYDYSNVPVTVTRRRSTINMAPWTDLMSSTWASLGAPTAYVNFSVLWWHQTRYLPGPYITDVYVYTIYNLVINQADCAAQSLTSCAKTNQYYMYTLVDANQPEGWTPYCYIISYDGHPPNVNTQARVCTPPGSDHSFRATNIPFGGWVAADCQGNASYGWPAWDPIWYRP